MYHAVVAYDWTAWGQRCQRLRERHGWTQANLAGRVGVSRNIINRVENALALPSVGLLDRLSDAYGMSLPTLLINPHTKERPPMTRCAIYARKSNAQSGRAEEERSVSVQVAECRAFAAARGWTQKARRMSSAMTVSPAPSLSGASVSWRWSGPSRRARPSLTLLVTAVDRIGREVIECSYWLKKLSEAGVRVIVTTTGQAITLDDPQSKLVAAVSGFAAEVERDQARSRTRRALRAKAERGHAVGAPAYGYQHREGPER